MSRMMAWKKVSQEEVCWYTEPLSNELVVIEEELDTMMEMNAGVTSLNIEDKVKRSSHCV